MKFRLALAEEKTPDGNVEAEIVYEPSFMLEGIVRLCVNEPFSSVKAETLPRGVLICNAIFGRVFTHTLRVSPGRSLSFERVRFNGGT